MLSRKALRSLTLVPLFVLSVPLFPSPLSVFSIAILFLDPLLRANDLEVAYLSSRATIVDSGDYVPGNENAVESQDNAAEGTTYSMLRANEYQIDGMHLNGKNIVNFI